MISLGEALETELFEARIDARRAALHQAEEQLDISVIDAAAFTDEDQSRSHLVAMSLIGAVGLAALLLLRQGKAHPLQVALALEDYRLRRVAATEVANAYSRMHYEIDPGMGWARMWDATLDLKTCKVCKRMHGEIRALDEPFTDGLVPGDVHPNCRCEPFFVRLQ